LTTRASRSARWTLYFYRTREDIEVEGLGKEVLKKISVVVRTFGKMSPLDLDLRV